MQQSASMLGFSGQCMTYVRKPDCEWPRRMHAAAAVLHARSHDQATRQSSQALPALRTRTLKSIHAHYRALGQLCLHHIRQADLTGPRTLRMTIAITRGTVNAEASAIDGVAALCTRSTDGCYIEFNHAHLIDPLDLSAFPTSAAVCRDTFNGAFFGGD